MDEEAAMEPHDQNGEEEFITIPTVIRHAKPKIVILRLGTKINLREAMPYHVSAAITAAAGLTTTESRDVTTQVRQLQNLVVAESRRESATQKLAALKTLQFGGEQHEITAYVAHEPDNARGVVKGLPLDVPDDELTTVITLEDRELLAARRLGRSTAILITVKGPELPKRALLGRSVTKIQPFRSKAVQCATCFTVRHRADVCPNARNFVRCEQCGLQFPPDQRPDRTLHECEMKCVNCGGLMGQEIPIVQRNNKQTAWPDWRPKNASNTHQGKKTRAIDTRKHTAISHHLKTTPTTQR